MLKGAIFDLDGTILDSMFIWDTIGEDYLRAIGQEPHEDLKKTFMTFTLEDAAEYYRKNYGVTLSVKEITAGVNTMIENIYKTKVMPKQGITEYIRFLKETNVKMCIATATDRHIAEETLERIGIRYFFSEIFTCTDIGSGKETPTIYRTALKHLGTKKEETYVFEDSLFALQTANSDGFPTVGVYDRHENRQDEMKRISNYYIYDFSDPVLKTI